MKDLPKYIDIGFCIIVLPVMLIMFPIERWFHNFHTYISCMCLWLYALYFVNRFFTVPSLFKEGRRRAGAIAFIVFSFIVTYIFSAITLYTPKPNIHDIGVVRIFPMVKQYQQAVWSLFMLVETFSFAVGLLIQMDRLRWKRIEVEAERDRAELNLYKAQIKPHFIFNTLNSLYGLVLTKSDQALPCLEKFISMTKYMQVNATKDMVSIEDEAAYIREYIALQSLRLSSKTHIDLTIEIDNGTLPVPPMLLVTFVENCFKHGISSTQESAITISILEHEGVMTLQTSNHIFPIKRDAGGMGIDNCRKRLDLIYPDRHELIIGRDNDEFNVKLIIILKDDKVHSN